MTILVRILGITEASKHRFIYAFHGNKTLCPGEALGLGTVFGKDIFSIAFYVHKRLLKVSPGYLYLYGINKECIINSCAYSIIAPRRQVFMASALSLVFDLVPTHGALTIFVMLELTGNITAAYFNAVSVYELSENLAAAAGCAIAPCRLSLFLVEQELRKSVTNDLFLVLQAEPWKLIPKLSHFFTVLFHAHTSQSQKVVQRH